MGKESWNIIIQTIDSGTTKQHEPLSVNQNRWFNIIPAAKRRISHLSSTPRYNTAWSLHKESCKKSLFGAFYSAVRAGNGPFERTRGARRKFWEKGVKETNARNAESVPVAARQRGENFRRCDSRRRKSAELRRFDNRGIVRAPRTKFAKGRINISLMRL